MLLSDDQIIRQNTSRFHVCSSPKNYREHFPEQTRRLSVGRANIIGTMTTNVTRHPFKALQAQQYRDEVIWFCIIR
jgi:hypothetical protein